MKLKKSNLAKPIFLLCTARTGSTYLQRLLNCSRELMIWGEHGGMLEPFFRAGRDIPWIQVIKPSLYYEFNLDLQTNFMPRIAPFDKALLPQIKREFITNLFASGIPEKVRWGFKEHTYCELELASSLKEIFPESTFVVLKRNPCDIALSQFCSSWGRELFTEETNEEDIKKLIKKELCWLKKYHQFCTSLSEKFPGEVIELAYEELCAHPYESMLNFAKLIAISEESFIKDKVFNVMKVKTGSSNYDLPINYKFDISQLTQMILEISKKYNI